MGIPIPVASSPVLISRSVSKPYLLYNAGAQTVYIGLDSSVSSINYAYPLAAGNAIQWSEINTDVYGVCATGQTTSLVLTPEASALSIGNVSATVTNPISLDQRVEQIYAKAVQPLTNGNTVIWDSAALGVSLKQYACLVISLNDPTVMTGLDTSRLIQVQVIQYDTSGNQVWIEAPMFYGSGLLNYTTAIRGASVQITASYVGGATTGNIGVHISGSQIAAEHKYYQVPGASGLFVNCADGGSALKPTSKYLDVVGSFGSGATCTVYLPTVAGTAYFQFFGGNTANEQHQMNLPGSNVFFLPVTVTPTARTYYPPAMIPFPEAPVIWQVANGAAAQSGRLLVTWE